MPTKPDQQGDGGDVGELEHAVEAIDILAQLALDLAQLAPDRQHVQLELFDLLALRAR